MRRKITRRLQPALLPVRSRGGVEGDLDEADGRRERRTAKSGRHAV